MNIVITPPFWKTWTFMALMALSFSVGGFVFYKRRVKNVRMITELRAAHNAQMSVMPHADPMIDGFDISGICIPANEVGGDFYDYLWLDGKNHRFGIVVGDVSGKGMRAAMTAVMSCGMIRSAAHEEESVGDVLSQINYPLYGKTEKDVFIAACLACFDRATKKLTFTNAGLIKPLLKSGDCVSNLGVNGATYPLGMISDVTYQENSIQLRSGDLLVFLTDGIPEAQNRTKEFYGDERLKSLVSDLNTHDLSASRIKDVIIEDVMRFSGVNPQHDDMTIVVVKIT
jgi:sigma-B regulation protein RsbU (phosphoserine phosphatase)